MCPSSSVSGFGPAGSARRPALRAALWLGVPTLALLALEVLPLVTGAETLVLRDVLEVHLMLKAPQADALRNGVLPLIDLHRFGGQPLLGNPNAVPLYPDNLLYLVAPVLWALNAHFWVHLILAPVAAYWLGRAWDLSRPAAWATGVCYALSGFFLSHLNLYNLVAGAALAPALVAAVVRAGRGHRWAVPATGALWALLLLSGDPLMAGLAGALALSAFLVRRSRDGEAFRRTLPRVGWTGLAVLAGTLVALPQIVELLRILPATYRGYWGYGDLGGSAVGAWRPVQALEWLVPLAFGRYDLQGAGGFWGRSLFGGELPIFLSLYPGVLALALVLAAGRPGGRHRAAGWWAWGSIAVGLLLSAGGGTPVGRWLFGLPWAASFRYPVKLWLLVAVGAALLCGIGWERAFGRRLGLDDGENPGPAGEARSLRRLGIPLGVLALVLAALLAGLVLAPAPFEEAVLSAAPTGWSPDLAPGLARAERARWIATLVAVLAVVLCLSLALLLARRRPTLGAALLLVVHAAGQLFLLGSLLLTDASSLYREPPPAVEGIPEDARVAHAGYGSLFGSLPRPPLPDRRLLWTLRQDFFALTPAAGILHGGYRYEMARSPEGLGSFLSRVAFERVSARGTSDLDRVRVLSRWGVELVIAERLLHSVPPEWARRVGTWRGPIAPVHVYRLPRAAPEVLFAETPLRTPHLNAAWDLLCEPGFDPERHAVLPGDAADPLPGGDADGPAGRLRVVRRGPEAVEVEVDAPGPGVLVVQRSHLPIWRATVDGAPAEVEPANLYRMGVRVPAGAHRVRLWVDRRPLVASLTGSGLGAAGLLALAVLAVRRRGRRAHRPRSRATGGARCRGPRARGPGGPDRETQLPAVRGRGPFR